MYVKRDLKIGESDKQTTGRRKRNRKLKGIQEGKKKKTELGKQREEAD